MAKDPAVLFYTSDFLSGTFTMDYEQKGKYITLLCIQHQKGFLTEKDLRTVLVDTDIEVFDKFILAEDGFYYNMKMKECAEKRKSYSESRRNNRKGKSNKNNDMTNLSKRYDEHMNNISSTYDKHMETGTGNETVNKNINVNEYTDADKLIAYKTLDKLTEHIDDNNIPAAKELVKAVIEDYNGFENILQLCYGDDETILKNWQQYYYNALQFLK